MSEMIERVAKAIMTANDQSTGIRFSYLCHDMARAAIEAMREPTRAMVEAAHDKLDWGYPDGVDANFYVAWEEMIDEALK